MRIGETAAAAGMTAKTLRFYEGRGLLPAADRAPNGYRDYPHETVSRLEFIRRGRTAGACARRAARSRLRPTE